MQSTLFDLLLAKRQPGSSSRTSLESSTSGTTPSAVSWLDWSASMSPSFLQGPAGGRARVWLMDPADAPHGAYSTPSTTPWPSVGNVSLCYLAEVLETGMLPRRYFLTSRACNGILNRAERRGKLLPSMFREVLQRVIARAPLEPFDPKLEATLEEEMEEVGEGYQPTGGE
jgi:hypothetical protein